MKRILNLKNSITVSMYLSISIFSAFLTACDINFKDKSAPEWSESFPVISNIQQTSVDVKVKINENGFVYYAILPDDGSEGPTAASLKSGVITGAIQTGSIEVTKKKESTISFTGLSEETAYNIFLAAEDDARTRNLQKDAVMLDFTTLARPDTASPEWISGYPLIDNIQQTTLDLKVKTNESGNVYYAILPDGAGAPIAVNLRSGAISNAIISGSRPVTADTEETINITGLTSGAVYNVYIVADDSAAAPNLQSNPVKLDATTLITPDTTAPLWATTYPKTGNIQQTTLEIKVLVNESGMVYYAVLPDGSSTPSAAEIKEGTASGAYYLGKIKVTASTLATISITGLSENAYFDIFLVAEDSSLNLQADVVKLDITTGITASAIISDHTYARLNVLSSIPETAINNAKSNLHIAYGHTSHGSQIITGMSGLVSFKGSLYAYNNGGTNGALDLRDTPFSGASDLGNPDRTSWASATRTYLNNNSDINVVIWSWCGQVSGASEANINTYLNLMSALETEFPNVKFVYMTGHTDGSGLSGNLHIRNRQIRDYCVQNNKILYDFEDIESYDPDDVYYGDKIPNDNRDYDSNGDGTRDSNWATLWQASHTLDLDWYSCSAAHSKPLNGNLKAYAAWYLWARIAGWDGQF